LQFASANQKVGSFTNPAVLAMSHVPARSDMDFIMTGGDVPTVDGLPLIKPPWSRITAIDLKTGVHLWMVPNGDTPERIRNHPALAGLAVPPTGGFTRPVVLATRTLLFTSDGSGGAPVLRALDKTSSALLWQVALPEPVTAQPMTYMVGGRQYLAVWVGNPRNRPATELLVFAIAK
jgi:quinoprotein glucose dehydrogenase